MPNNIYQFNMPVVLKPVPIENYPISVANLDKSLQASIKDKRDQETIELTNIEAGDYQRLKFEQEEIIHIFMWLVTKLLDGSTQNDSISIKEKQNFYKGIRKMFEKVYALVECEDSCFIAAMILLDRVHSLNDSLRLSFTNIRLYISAALLVAFKYCVDNAYSNSQLAHTIEIDNKTLNKMELKFLGLLNFEIYIDPSIYQRYEKMIWNYSQRNKRSLMCSTQ